MKVLFFTHHYAPEVAAAARRVTSFVKVWGELGAEVDVVAPLPHYPTGKRDDSGSQKLLRATTGEFGERIHRLPFVPGGTDGARKFADHLVGAGAAMLHSARACDVVVATVPTLPMIAPAIAAGRLRRVPVVLDFRDAWPDLIEESGAFGHERLGRGLATAVEWGQAAADAILTTTDGFAEVLAERFPGKLIRSIPNGVHVDSIPSLEAARRGDGEPLRVLYLGTHGLSQDLEVAVRALSRFDDGSIEARFIGDGAAKPELVRLAGALESPIRFESPVVGGDLWAAYEWSDVCLVPLRDWPSFDFTVPSKIYEVQAVGRLVLGALRGEAAAILDSSGGGRVVEPGSVEAMVAGLNVIRANPALLDVGDKPRSWVEEHADRDLLALSAYEVLTDAVRRHRSSDRSVGLLDRNARRIRMARNVGPGAIVRRLARRVGPVVESVHGIGLLRGRHLAPGSASSVDMLAGEAATGWPVDLGQFNDPTRSTASFDEMVAGRFCFRAEHGVIDLDRAWSCAEASDLWHFDLHSFTWLQAFVEGGRVSEGRRLVASWLSDDESDPSPARWHSYPTSLRAWEWCRLFGQVFVATDLEGAITESLRHHYEVVGRDLERDLGGNHLIKNLKALVGLEVLFDRPVGSSPHMAELMSQVKAQVDADGGHRERSTAYHIEVLTDLLELRELCRSTGQNPPAAMESAIEAMGRFLDALTLGGNYVPTVGDGWAVEPTVLRKLMAARATSPSGSGHRGDEAGIEVLADSGLVVARTGPTELLVDTGQTCWPRLPGHGHGSALSFVLADSGRPIIVDPPTTTYAPGEQRNLERSSFAHSTAVIDGTDQGEFWGAFRVGRIPQSELVAADVLPDGSLRVVGDRSDVGHRRTWTLQDGRLEIVDEFAASHRRVELVLCLAMAADPVNGLESGGWELVYESEEIARCVVEPAAWGGSYVRLLAAPSSSDQPWATTVSLQRVEARPAA